MVRAIEAACDGDFTKLPAQETYFWQHLIRHLRKAGRGQRATQLMTDYAWIKAKLHAVGTRALFETYLPEPDDPACQLVGRTIALSLAALAVDPDELPRQIFGRLGNSALPAAIALVTAAQSDPNFWPVPRWPALTSSGAERLRLHGHEGPVRSAAFSPEGARIVTGSHDGTARVWDAHTGEPIATMQRHRDWVNSAAFSPDGAFYPYGHPEFPTA